MRVIRLPRKVRALIFDLDSTLYTNPEYAAFQTDILIREYALRLGVSDARARLDVEEARKRISERSGKATSLGNAMAELGVDIPTSVEWRRKLIRPGEWLIRDERLRETLAELEKRFFLALVTNNPRSVGEESLEALGVRDRFKTLVGLDDTMVSKPDPEPFERAAKTLGVPLAECVSIGDRYDVDLSAPLGLGMGAVLVDGASDVYRLPELLSG